LDESFCTFEDTLEFVSERHLTKVKLCRLAKEGCARSVKRRSYQIMPL
jgi:hypothetical protein